jgi:type II secretory pathway pseudopilin PulG
MKRRTGLTRLEFVLAVLIAAILAGLILPAIMRVRDAAALSKCKNNLKQIVLACHNYNDAYQGKLPPLTDQGSGAPTGSGLPSLFFNIVPYIEADWLYYVYKKYGPTGYYAQSKVLVFSGDWKGSHAEQWGGSANQVHHIYTDPADATAHDLRDIPMTLPDGATGYYATGSYAANGLVFGSNNAQFPQSFPDGVSYTIMISERPQVCTDAAGATVYNLWGLGFYSPHMPAFATLTPNEPPGLLSTGQVAPVVPLPPREQADQMLIRIGRDDAEPRRPDFATPIQMLRGTRPCDPRLPGAMHFAGMQAAMGDGSVHLFAWTVSPWVFWGACTPNGGENLRADW